MDDGCGCGCSECGGITYRSNCGRGGGSTECGGRVNSEGTGVEHKFF